MNGELLFNKYDLRAVIQKQSEKAEQAIDGLDANKLLSTPVNDLVDFFYENYKIQPLRLFPDQISVNQAETKIDVSQDPRRPIFDRSRSVYVDGTRITFYIPFEGDKDLFFCRASTFSFNPPYALVTKNEVIFTYEILDHNAERVKTNFDGDQENLNHSLEWINKDVNGFNGQLLGEIRERIDWRRQKILDDQGLVASLGFPLRERKDAPKTYSVPIERKKIKPLPPVFTTPYSPEPSLEMKEYDQILSIISNMVLVMERSPRAFHDMNEEDLRQHFLVQLNGQYEGQATGETFNYSGKTDILIRVSGKNVFIAECKFWKGEKVLFETIDQLLGYTQWRDTKTTILIFNRNKNFSEVVYAIPEIVKKHPSCKRQIPCEGETNSRYVFHQINDPNRELILSVMAFNVPGNG